MSRNTDHPWSDDVIELAREGFGLEILTLNFVCDHVSREDVERWYYMVRCRRCDGTIRSNNKVGLCVTCQKTESENRHRCVACGAKVSAKNANGICKVCRDHRARRCDRCGVRIQRTNKSGICTTCLNKTATDRRCRRCHKVLRPHAQYEFCGNCR